MSSPEDIAKYIFAGDACPPNSIDMGLEEGDYEYIFEILLSVLMEGIEHMFGKDAELTMINQDILATINERLSSIGFTVYYITETTEPEQVKSTRYKGDHYCLIRKNDLPDYFIQYANNRGGNYQPKSEKKYRLVLNNDNPNIPRNGLNDFTAIFYNDTDDQKFSIWFKHHIAPTTCSAH